MKEGCLETIIEDNDIFMQHDENAGGMLAAPTVAVCADGNAGMSTQGKAVIRTNQSRK